MPTVWQIYPCHQYLDVSGKRIYEALQDSIGDFIFWISLMERAASSPLRQNILKTFIDALRRVWTHPGDKRGLRHAALYIFVGEAPMTVV